VIADRTAYNVGYHIGVQLTVHGVQLFV